VGAVRGAVESASGPGGFTVAGELASRVADSRGGCGSQFGKDMSTEEKALLDAEQKDRLKSLKDAAKLVGETIS